MRWEERQRFLECKEQLSSSQIEKAGSPGRHLALEVHLLQAMEFFQACQDFRYLKEDTRSEVPGSSAW